MTDAILKYWQGDETGADGDTVWAPHSPGMDPVLTWLACYSDAAGSVTIIRGATAATVDTAMAGNNNDVTITARRLGTRGSEITLTLVDPSANDASLAVTVTGTAVSVSLATNGSGTITTTGQQLVDALNSNSSFKQLAVAKNKSGNDGTGAVIALASTPLAGGTDETIAKFTFADTFDRQIPLPPGEFRAPGAYLGVSCDNGATEIAASGYYVQGYIY